LSQFSGFHKTADKPTSMSTWTDGFGHPSWKLYSCSFILSYQNWWKNKTRK